LMAIKTARLVFMFGLMHSTDATLQREQGLISSKEA